jgi:hypothetical protein
VPWHGPFDDIDTLLTEQPDGAVDAAVPTEADIRRPDRWILGHQLDPVARLMDAQESATQGDLPHQRPTSWSVSDSRLHREKSVVKTAGRFEVTRRDCDMIDPNDAVHRDPGAAYQ